MAGKLRSRSVRGSFKKGRGGAIKQQECEELPGDRAAVAQSEKILRAAAEKRKKKVR